MTEGSTHECRVVLRALREAAGVTQEGWAARLGYARRTIQRWEHGDLQPDSAAGEALVGACSDFRLLRRFTSGPLAGVDVTRDWLLSVLADARASTPETDDATRGGRIGALTGFRTPLSAFIGRDYERAAVRETLLGCRMLTLTGMGGIGKTRLALQVAVDLSHEFADGVFLVDLSGVAAADMVVPAIAKSLDVQAVHGSIELDAVINSIGQKSILLLLDNFEHVLPAALHVPELLQACSNVKVITTSRTPLHVDGEHEMQLSPLRLPTRPWPPTEQMLAYEAIRLFVDRARAVRADFEPTAESSPIIAEICTRLDGLPLAIELAAAWVKVLPVAALLDQLKDRLTLLVGTSRDKTPRQKALRDTLDWSYDLLDPAVQAIFRKFAVFTGGCTLEAAIQTCSSTTILDAIASLVDHSLLVPVAAPDGEARFTMLETVREFAMERLIHEGDYEKTRRAHAEFFLGLCERTSPQLIAGAQRAPLLRRLERDEGNLLAAMRWCLESGEADLGLRLGAAGSRYWFIQGSREDCRNWRTMLEQVLHGGDGEAAARAEALNGAGVLAYDAGDYTSATTFHKEALAIARQLTDPTLTASSLHYLGRVAIRLGDDGSALQLLDEALTIQRALGDQPRVSVGLNIMAGLLAKLGDYKAASRLHAEAAVVCGQIGDPTGVAEALSRQSFASLMLGDVEGVREPCERAMALARQDGNLGSIAWCCLHAAAVLLSQREYVAARAACVECIRLGDSANESQVRLALALQLLGSIAVETDQLERGLRLFGAAEAIQATRGTRSLLFERWLRRWRVAAATLVGEARASVVLAEAREFSTEDTIACALADAAALDDDSEAVVQSPGVAAN